MAAALIAADNPDWPPKFPVKFANWLKSILLLAKMFVTAVVRLLILILDWFPAAAAAAAS